MTISSEEDSLGLGWTSGKINAMQRSLLVWFQANGRHEIPWKLKSDGTKPKDGEFLNPYGIWIAEVMLQQTQLKVVCPYWEKWMESFPALSDLAIASEHKVLMQWQGLGYYSRARRILSAAKQLLETIGDADSLDPEVWPTDLDTWMALPGIGRTTAGSILSSAFDLPTPLLDGNVKRVLSRLVANSKPQKFFISKSWELSRQLLDRQNPRNFNQALMDLGAIVCTPHNPNCCECPWNSVCTAYSSRRIRDFPVKRSNATLPYEVIGIGIVLNIDGKVLIDQRLDEGLLGGMWEFPGGKQELGENIKETIARELREELAIEIEVGELLISLDHLYSHKKLCFVVHLCKWISGDPEPLESQQCRWVKPNELNKYPFPAANLKMISALNNYLKQDK